MSDDYGSAAMRDAEANEPGFVHRYGWTHIECGDCGAVMYEGRLISAEDTAQIKKTHRVACTKPGGTTP